MKKVIIIGSSIVVLILVLFFFHFQTYTLHDIDADNFKNKLKSSDHSIWDCMIDDYIPDNLGLWAYGTDYQIEHPLNTKVEIKKINSERKSVTIYNTPSNLSYFVVFKSIRPSATIFCKV
ncbi:MAG: hypothetical protein Q7J86_07495 [Bacteroidota bacterium]|nr:hypothetical protein [Bacteroidota bacterium]